LLFHGARAGIRGYARQSFGRTPQKSHQVGWTDELRIARSPQGRTTLSPALGVIIGFIIWAIIVSASIVFYART
jgi:hypothetical protein